MPTKKEGKKSKTQEDLVKKLIDNFASLQKVMTNLAVKFDTLSDQISKLLQLFEISAKSLEERKKGGSLIDDSFIKKLDEILDQNKTIARGMVLIGERLTEIEEEEGMQKKSHQPEFDERDLGRNIFPSQRPKPRPRPLPKY